MPVFQAGVAKNALISRATQFGRVTVGTWPASSDTTSFEPATSSTSRSDDAKGAMTSCRPCRTSVGKVMDACAGIAPADDHQPGESLRVPQCRLQGDHGPHGFSGQHAGVDVQCIEHTEQVADQQVEGDGRCAVPGGTGASMVIGDGSPRPAQPLERRGPQLSASHPAAMRDDRSRGVSIRCDEQFGVAGLEKHGISFGLCRFGLWDASAGTRASRAATAAFFYACRWLSPLHWP